MNIQPLLLCCVTYAELCGLISAQVISVTGTEGQGITVRCHFSFSGNRKFFCKENCNPDNVLIETSEEKAQKGKYSIEYEGTVHSPVLFVTIKPLSMSDAGRYKCGMSMFFGNSEQEVKLIVKAAPTTSSPSSTPSTTLSQGSEASVSDTRSEHFLPLVVCVPVVVLVLAAVLFLRCKKKTQRKVDGVTLDYRNTKIEPHENSVFHTREDAIYESLDPIRSDQDTTYSTLLHTHTIHKGIQE
ncbi:CMRF35-like molecule 5 isoform X1 [Haplochromis burtoni]|uniref:CMRF35-like molecule 5 isoform X1 n=1 Tax=Haplochromis burtoni TaxID=8153 RepID=UPI001C2D187C|nr:CMRF35-like molecule 5 isoform X1 [Haplochromis burtoni]